MMIDSKMIIHHAGFYLPAGVAIKKSKYKQMKSPCRKTDTQEYDYPGVFQVAIKEKIIDT